MQYKLAFTRHIDMYIVTANTSYCFEIYRNENLAFIT